jgi:hypothetical protein
MREPVTVKSIDRAMRSGFAEDLRRSACAAA